MKKYYKKIMFGILVLIILLMISANYSYAKKNNIGFCSIDNTPKYITQYIKDIRKVIGNINKSSIQKEKELKEIGELNNDSITKIYGILNNIFTWKGYSLDFEYSILENLKEIPEELERDIKILEKEKDNLLKYYEKFSQRDSAYKELKISEICDGVVNSKKICEKYLEENERGIEVLLKLSKGINSIILKIKNSATNIDLGGDINTFLISDETIDKIKKDYSKESINQCSLKDDGNGNKGFFKTITDSIKDISFAGKNSEKTIGRWQEAIDLLLGKTDEKKYRETQRNLLKQELQKQGLSGDSASVIMGNLEAYNDNGKLFGGEDGFLSSLKKQIDEFEETLKKEEKKLIEKGFINASKFELKAGKIRESEKIKIDVNNNYLKLKEFALQDDNTNETLAKRMIDMHLNISEAINILNKSCEISVRVCNSQKRGLGNCGKCN